MDTNTYRRLDLAKSEVHFSERNHRYTLEGRELSGVTSLIKAMLFPDKYAGIAPLILERKAKRGTAIHQMVQDKLMHRPTIGRINQLRDEYPEFALFLEELEPFRGLTLLSQRIFIDDEYLVSDNTQVATMIDLVDSSLNLYDIKTTSTLDIEYLSWQLSIGAYLFDLQNSDRGLKANRLFALWITPDKAQCIEVARKPDTEVMELLQAFAEGGTFTPAVAQSEELATIYQYEEQIIHFKQAIKAVEEMKERSLARLREEMEQSGTKKIETERLIITLVGEQTKTTFDTKRFKEDHPDLAEAYSRETISKGYVKITLRGA